MDQLGDFVPLEDIDISLINPSEYANGSDDGVENLYDPHTDYSLAASTASVSVNTQQRSARMKHPVLPRQIDQSLITNDGDPVPDSTVMNAIIGENSWFGLRESLTEVVSKDDKGFRDTLVSVLPTENVNAAPLAAQDDSIRPYSHRVVDYMTTAVSDNPSDPAALVALNGKSLNYFSRSSPVRRFVFRILSSWLYGPFIYLCISTHFVVLLVRSILKTKRHGDVWGDWSDKILLVLFIVYTLEAAAKILAYGLVLNPDTDTHQFIFKLLHRASISIRREVRIADVPSSPIKLVRTSSNAHRPPNVRLAYLRTVGNRLWLFCVICYWIYLGCVLAARGERHAYINVLRGLTCLRLVKVLEFWDGTANVYSSIKRAGPFLLNVLLFISLFWLLFTLLDPDDSTNTYITNHLCGGYLHALTKEIMPYIPAHNSSVISKPKGYICPIYSVCVEQPYNVGNGTVSFDNIFDSFKLVFVVMGLNGFSELMQYTSDSDGMISSIFYVAGVVVLGWWMFNMFLAVVSTSYLSDINDSRSNPSKTFSGNKPLIRKYPESLDHFCLVVIVVNFIISCFTSSSMSPRRANAIYVSELVTTIVLAVEMVIRIGFAFPYLSVFFKSLRNAIDFVLAIATVVIITPKIRLNSTAYPWLTAFQIARIYRISINVRYLRQNWEKFLASRHILLGLVFFIFLVLGLTAIFTAETFVGFATIGFSSFQQNYSTAYQILSTEGWADLMFEISESLAGTGMAAISAIICCCIFLFMNGIVMNLLVGLVQSNFEISDRAKWKHQIVAFCRGYRRTELGQSGDSMNDFPGSKNRRHTVTPGHMRQLLSHTDNLEEDDDNEDAANNDQDQAQQNSSVFSIARWAHAIRLPTKNPFFHKPDFTFNESLTLHDAIQDLLDKHDKHKKDCRDYLRANPNFNRALFCLRPHNSLRRFCQSIVRPGAGNRYDDAALKPKLASALAAFILTCVAGMVLIAFATTPYYQKQYYQNHNCDPMDISSHCAFNNWMGWTDFIFAVIFTIEAAVKICADGFIYTPSAYALSLWNVVDLLVLATLWADVCNTFLRGGANYYRFLRAFKAFRALRLLHVSKTAKRTFHNMIFVGFGRIVGAAIFALTLIVPFSLWGVNLFAGKFKVCQDQTVSLLSECYGEFNSSNRVASDNFERLPWSYLVPRSYDNPAYSFDSFGHAMSVLIQIVSLEGWTNVLRLAQSAVSKTQSVTAGHDPGQGAFVYIFNFLSMAFISTLFVSVVIQGYSERTGSAFYTEKQRSFLEMQRILANVKPSRTAMVPGPRWRRWCHSVAVNPRNVCHRLVNYCLLCLAIVLCSEHYPYKNENANILARDILYCTFTAFLTAYFTLRMFGLSWNSYTFPIRWDRWKRHIWDICWLAVSSAGHILSWITLFYRASNVRTTQLFVLVLLLLAGTHRFDRLNRLYFAAQATMSSIAALLAAWVVLFFGFAIAFNQIFGLTRTGPNGDQHTNFRTITKSLLLLFRMSSGEGWNDLMYDYIVEDPFCVNDPNFYKSDCGSITYAHFLFFAWNVVSMYIFFNMFVSLIYESFSFVYQRSEFAPFFSRKAIRKYKAAWYSVDKDGDGYISRAGLGKFLRLLEAPFDVGIYDSSYRRDRLLNECRYSVRHSVHGAVVEGIDIDALNRLVADIDVAQIRKRREKYESLYEEVLAQEVLHKGIPFLAPLTTIPYYKLSEDENSGPAQYLLLHEFIERQGLQSRIADQKKRNAALKLLLRTIRVRRQKRLRASQPDLDRTD